MELERLFLSLLLFCLSPWLWTKACEIRHKSAEEGNWPTLKEIDLGGNRGNKEV